MAGDMLATNLQKVLNKEYIKRLLIRYFISKGFEDTFDTYVYAPLIIDMPYLIPQMASKIEIVPYVDEIVTTSNKVRVGWNLYVLGVHRMHLGTSIHKSMAELRNPTAHGEGRRIVTPKQILEFIVEVLGKSKNGLLDPTDRHVDMRPAIPSMRPRIGPTASGGYYEKNKPVY